MDTQTTAPQTPADRAGTVAHDTKQAAGDVASTAGHEVKQVTREAKDQAQQLWSQTRRDLTDQAATQQTRVAGGLRELADQLSSMADSSDQGGMAKGLVDDAARRAGDVASWLDQRDPGTLLDEARGFARQRPGTFLAIAAGVGVLAGRLSRSLVDEARDSDDSTGADAGSTATPAAGNGNGYAVTSNGYGTNGGSAMPVATSPAVSSTSSLPVTPGATSGAFAEGSVTVPGDQLPGAHRAGQPIAPDGTPSPITSEGRLTADGDDALRGH